MGLTVRRVMPWQHNAHPERTLRWRASGRLGCVACYTLTEYTEFKVGGHRQRLVRTA